MIQPQPTRVFILLFIITSYLALWNSSLRYGLSLPITSNNDLFLQWRNYALMIGSTLLPTPACEPKSRSRRSC